MTETWFGTTTPEALGEATWPEVRQMFSLDPSIIHLNTGTIGAMPHAVLEANDQVTRHWTGGLLDVYAPSMYTEHREVVAAAHGVDEDEIFIGHNATEAVARVLHGLDLHAGDEVVTTTQECYSVLSNLNLLRNRHGITVTALTLPVGEDASADQIVELFEQAITPQTKVFAFAGITLWTGTQLPIRRLCDLAQAHGITTVVDGALMTGMREWNFRELGPDFICCSGSKYQCGPLGTGISYVRNKVNPEHNPLPLPTFWPIISTWYPMIGAPPPRTTTDVASCNMGDYLQSAGSASIARGAAVGMACRMWDAIGRAKIGQRVEALGEHARQRIVELFGAGCVYSPADPALQSPLVAWAPFPATQDAWSVAKINDFVNRLSAEHQIWTRWTEFEVPTSSHQQYAVRVSPHIFNSFDEIDQAVSIMYDLSRELK